MREFRFRLEGLLRIRKVEEDRCLGRLRRHQCAVSDALERKRQLESERGRTLESLRRLESGTLEMEEVLRHRRYLVALENRGREVDAEVIRRRYEMQGVQREAEKAVRERQLVERLQERQREDHDVEELRREVRELDEIAGVSFVRAGAAEDAEMGDETI
ncbi:MAG: flagellar export protein FliJ [Planctomycetota bacterium]|jgi:flagellar FliJ protein